MIQNYYRKFHTNAVSKVIYASFLKGEEFTHLALGITYKPFQKVSCILTVQGGPKEITLLKDALIFANGGQCHICFDICELGRCKLQVNKRVTYGQDILNLEDEVDDFSTTIIMSDEAHFHLIGYVNKQNQYFWGTENPRVMHEKPLHPLKVTAWCAVRAGGVIGPFFFKNAAVQTTTVDGARYRAMLTEFFVPQLNVLRLENMWFQQDGATAHTARATTDILADIIFLT